MLGSAVKRFSPLLLLFAHFAQATVYSNAINEPSWQAGSSVFACELVHSVPYYGEAVFRTRAGERSAFYLRAFTSRFKAGEARLIAKAPVWKNSDAVEVLAEVAMKQGKRPLYLNNTLTELMLARLSSGNELALERVTWYEAKTSHKPAMALALSSIGFREAYDKYLGCLSGLIPRNFDQLKRTVLMFPGGDSDELPSSLARQLNHILSLVKHDSKVRYIYIDGHTDSVGDRDENLELSKARADMVSQYLQRRGVPEDWLTVRWHGERYPVAANGNSTGRARNRRVTVRLEHVEEIEVLPLASNN